MTLALFLLSLLSPPSVDPHSCPPLLVPVEMRLTQETRLDTSTWVVDVHPMPPIAGSRFSIHVIATTAPCTSWVAYVAVFNGSPTQRIVLDRNGEGSCFLCDDCHGYTCELDLCCLLPDGSVDFCEVVMTTTVL